MITNATARDIEGPNDIFELHFVLVSFSKKEDENCQTNCESKELIRCEDRCDDKKDECILKCIKQSKQECMKCNGIDDIEGCPAEGCEDEDSCMLYCITDFTNCRCETTVRDICAWQCQKKGRKYKNQHILKSYLNGKQIYDYALKNGSQIQQINVFFYGGKLNFRHNFIFLNK
jgi:hypothetical protein